MAAAGPAAFEQGTVAATEPSSVDSTVERGAAAATGPVAVEPCVAATE